MPVTIKYGLKPVFVDSRSDRSVARDNQVLGDDQTLATLYREALVAIDGARLTLTYRSIS